MWRLLATMLLFAGCNTLFGIHELHPDSTSDPCTGPCDCKVDDDCSAPHTACIDNMTSRTCECAAGYAMAQGECSWSGVVDDPGFNQSSDRWMISGMAMRDASAIQVNGMQDPGQIVLSTDVNCTNTGQATQTMMMPRRSRAEPLVLRATYSSETRMQPLVGIGSGWYDRQLTESDKEKFITSRVCLGAAHYAAESTAGAGHEVPLTMTTQASGSCNQSGPLNLDHVDIVPALPNDGCPDPGRVPNGDAEGAGGWTFQMSGSIGVNALIAAGVGANASHGVRLQTAQRCDRATAIVPISVPLADGTGSPALSLYHAGSSGALSAFLDQIVLPLSGSGQSTVDRYCIPAPLRGGVFQFRATLYTGGAGICTDTVSAQAIIDDVAVANDPLCGTDIGVANPGFESGAALLTASAIPGQSSVTVNSDSNAHGGQRDLQLTVLTSCTSASYQTQVATPPVNPGEGAAIEFWYRLPPGTSVFQVSNYKQTFVTMRDGQWHQGVACLAPRPAGLAQPFFVRLSTTSTTCGAITAETVFVDDLTALSTPMCPAM